MSRIEENISGYLDLKSDTISLCYDPEWRHISRLGLEGILYIPTEIRTLSDMDRNLDLSLWFQVVNDGWGIPVSVSPTYIARGTVRRDWEFVSTGEVYLDRRIRC